jgi:hypothetical protein
MTDFLTDALGIELEIFERNHPTLIELRMHGGATIASHERECNDVGL